MSAVELGRHIACRGCCSCLGTVLPIVPPAPPTPSWLLAEPDAFHTPADFFAVQVVHARQLGPEERVEAARAFLRVHGEGALRDALESAQGVDALPRELERVLDRLKVRAGAGGR